jgi:cyclic pyranopterin phosphate synthase
MTKFSHTDSEGKARMVNVGNKEEQRRVARAKGFIKLQAETVKLIKENQVKKGDVLTVCEIAGIQAAKRTGELIPLCHPVPLTDVQVQASLGEDGVEVESEASCIGRTGVEMEALTAVSTALLTVYDMCKAVDKNMKIGEIHLIEKKKEAV